MIRVRIPKTLARRLLLSGLLLGFFTTHSFGSSSSPRLMVIVVVDQMRADYLDTYASEFTGGLKTLREQSARFSGARFSQVPTKTAPGHATIITGKPPSETGIIGNEWFDRAIGERVDSEYDPNHGVGPSHLLTLSLGDVLKKSNPLSKVVSVSFKSRASVFLGGRDPDIAIWFSIPRREFVTSTYYGSIPAWLPEFNSKHKKQFPYWPLFALNLRSPVLDDYVLELTKETLRQYQLGKDSACDLLAISFSATDNIGHRYGPFSPEIHDQLLNLDRVLGELLQEVNNYSGGDFALILTADHGILPAPEQVEGKKLGGRRVSKKGFRKNLERHLEKVYGEGPWVLDINIPDVYLNHSLVDSHGISWDEFLSTTSTAVLSLDGVAAVFRPPEFVQQDEFISEYRRSYSEGRSGDLMVRLQRGVLVTDARTDTNHGSPYDYDSAVPLIFHGKYFITNNFPSIPDVMDIAPTCAQLLKLEFPAPEYGRVLTEIFSPAP